MNIGRVAESDDRLSMKCFVLQPHRAMFFR